MPDQLLSRLTTATEIEKKKNLGEKKGPVVIPSRFSETATECE